MKTIKLKFKNIKIIFLKKLKNKIIENVIK